MPSDLPTFRARLLDERAAVVAELAAIDLADEQAKIANAEAILRTAQNQFDKAQRRWTMVQDRQQRLVKLDADIALVTP